MLDNLNALLGEQIKDLYSAENQLLKALPKMAKAATNDSLRECFEAHLEETKIHVERLQEIARILKISPGEKKCKAMEGLLEEGKEVLEEDGNDACIDAALIISAQKVEHYEISSYGSASAIAEHLGEDEIMELLEATLEEEEAADMKLTDISLSEILPAADQGEEGEESEDGDEEVAEAASIETQKKKATPAKKSTRK